MDGHLYMMPTRNECIPSVKLLVRYSAGVSATKSATHPFTKLCGMDTSKQLSSFLFREFWQQLPKYNPITLCSNQQLRCVAAPPVRCRSGPFWTLLQWTAPNGQLDNHVHSNLTGLSPDLGRGRNTTAGRVTESIQNNAAWRCGRGALPARTPPPSRKRRRRRAARGAGGRAEAEAGPPCPRPRKAEGAALPRTGGGDGAAERAALAPQPPHRPLLEGAGGAQVRAGECARRRGCLPARLQRPLAPRGLRSTGGSSLLGRLPEMARPPRV